MSETSRELDTRARSRAQREFDVPLVVEAGAGTGKTAVLTSRLVAWSLGPGWQRGAARLAEVGKELAPDAIARDVLSRIAAITFTEAAAAEMAIRIERALHGVELGVAEPWLDEWVLPERAQCVERARALREALDHLTVRTIHAWCRMLLSRFPIAAGLHPDFEVDATGRVQAEALQRVLEQRLRAEYTTGGPLLELAELEEGPAAIYEAMNALIDEGVRASELDFDPLHPDRIAGPLLELRDAFAALASLAGPTATLPGASAEVFPLIAETLAAIDLAPDSEIAPAVDAGHDPAALERFVDELRKRWDEREDQLKNWGKGEGIKRICAGLAVAEADFAQAAARAHSAFDVFWRLHPRHLRAAHRAFQTLSSEFEDELARRSAVTYSQLLLGARNLLIDHPRIANGLRAELELLLVDEFQDTDALQCQIVRALGLEGPAADRPSLFVVGDPKQSIYGWRNADLAAYGEFVRAIEAEGGERLSLCVNFRSVPAVLDEVERVIQPVMRHEAGVQPHFESLQASDELRAAPGFSAGERRPIEHWVSWNRPDDPAHIGRTSSAEATELEARAFATDVAQLHDDHEVAFSDIALLLRSRGDLERYLRALRDAGVPYVVSGERSYFARREVVDAIAGLRCVLDPNDHVALLSLIRSASVGVPDAALFPLWAIEFPRLAGALHSSRPAVLVELAEQIRAVARRLPDGVPGIERIAGWEESLIASLAAVARLRESFELDAPDRFVERLRSELAIETSEAGRFPAPFRIANLERLYRELASELAAGADEHALLRRLRTAAERERDVDEPVVGVEDAVQVMTVHGAKGLGFEHVYVAQVHKGPPSGGGPSKTVERIGDRLEYRLLGTGTPGFARAMAERERRERAEEVRTLYVALTRAKQRLVIMGARNEAGPDDLEKARGHAALLAHRDGHPPLLERLREMWDSGGSCFEEAGARWRFLALEDGRDVLASGRRSELDWSKYAAADPRPLEAARREAQRRMQRPRRGAASTASHAALRDEAAESGFEPHSEPAERSRRQSSQQPENPLRRGDAMAVGTAVHALLEDWDMSAAPADELERQRARLPAVLAALGVNEDDGRAQAEARSIVDGFAGSELFERFASLGERVIARELPVLLPILSQAPLSGDPGRGGDGVADPEWAEADAAPLEAVVGSIDLVYRDPDGGLVIVDFKSDRVASPEERATKAAQYAPQGQIYVRALAQGLHLETPPRFELWFLRDGTVASPLD